MGGEGTTLSQSPACGNPQERARTWERVVGAVEKRCCNEASSMAYERGFWRKGTSTSSRQVQSGRAAVAARAVTAALMWWDGPGENPSMFSTRDWEL